MHKNSLYKYKAKCISSLRFLWMIHPMCVCVFVLWLNLDLSFLSEYSCLQLLSHMCTATGEPWRTTDRPLYHTVFPSLRPVHLFGYFTLLGLIHAVLYSAVCNSFILTFPMCQTSLSSPYLLCVPLRVGVKPIETIDRSEADSVCPVWSLCTVNSRCADSLTIDRQWSNRWLTTIRAFRSNC